MGYPVRYRRGSSPQMNRGGAMIPDEFLFGPPFLAGAAAALWASERLLNAVQGLGSITYRTSPSAYGWTLTQDCGRPPQKEIVAWSGNCNPQIILEGTWQLAPAPNRTSAFYWQTSATNFTVVAGQRRYNNVLPAQRWDRGLAGAMPVAVYGPNWNNGILLGGAIPLPVARAMGFREAGFAAPDTVANTGRRRRGYAEQFTRVIFDPDAPVKPQNPPRPVVTPRAVPYPAMRETKIGMNTRAGRAFMGILQAFNFMGDVWGFTSALWRALPSSARGSSRSLPAMMGDLYSNWGQVDLGVAALNTSLWKFSDSVMGSQQASMMGAQASVYGWQAARAWAMLDSQIRASTQSLTRTMQGGRAQASSRG